LTPVIPRPIWLGGHENVGDIMGVSSAPMREWRRRSASDESEMGDAVSGLGRAAELLRVVLCPRPRG
jgi:hypothetical protein